MMFRRIKQLLSAAGVCAALVLCSVVGASGQTGVPAAESAQVVFRCAFWEKPAKPGRYFVQEDGKYKYLNILQMAFAREYVYRGKLPIPIFREATEEEIAARKAEGVKAADAAYVPVASINPRGMRNIGVVFLPGALERNDEKSKLVFDYNDRAFPYGSIRVMNFSTRNLLGRIIPRGGQPENFRVRHGEVHMTKPIEEERQICEIQFAAVVNKAPKLVYSSAAAFFKNTRSILFVVPADAATAKDPNALPKLDFRILKDHKPVEPPAEAEGGAPEGAGRPPSAAAPERERRAPRPQRPPRTPAR